MPIAVSRVPCADYLDEIGRQRTAEYGGAVRKDIRALPEKVDENTPKFAIDFLDYYDNPKRGQHPNSTGYYSYTSLAPMMNFFPFAQIETISPRRYSSSWEKTLYQLTSRKTHTQKQPNRKSCLSYPEQRT